MSTGSGSTHFYAGCPPWPRSKSWWLTADLAAAADEPRWRAMVDERVAAIAAACGRYAETINRAAEERAAPPR